MSNHNQKCSLARNHSNPTSNTGAFQNPENPENLQELHNAQVAVWVYVCGHTGILHSDLAAADRWLKRHPQHPLNFRAIRRMIH